MGYKTVYQGGEGEYIEKKSRFIATVRLVETEAQAVEFIEEMKKKYWNATHNCSAFIIGRKAEIVRYSDDGEPGGTAGKPMLEVLQKEEIRNIAVVVTRYFGGTLLGTGGLVRAYTKAVQEGIRNSVIIEKMEGVLIALKTDYNGVGKIQYLIGQEGYPIVKSEYGENVILEVLVPVSDEKTFTNKIIEGTNGRAGLEEKERLYYAKRNGEVLTFYE